MFKHYQLKRYARRRGEPKPKPRWRKSWYLVVALFGLVIAPATWAAPVNLIKNSSLETSTAAGTPDGWRTGRWGTNQTKFTYPVAGYNSARAAKVEMTQYTSGDAKWYPLEVPVTPGKTYEFRDNYKSSAVSYVTLQYRRSDGTLRWDDIAKLEPTATWQNVRRVFTIPADVTGVTVFHLIKTVGSLTVDNYLLSQMPTRNAMVSINFDDGWKNGYQYGVPILNRAGIPGSHYIISERLSDNFPGYIKANDVLALQAAGHEIGSHARTHADLTKLSESQVRAEIVGSRSDLKAIGVATVDTFAYPFGAYNDTVVRLVRENGFIGARTTNGGENNRWSNRYLLNRKTVEQNTTLAQVKEWINSSLRNGTWLILVFHKIDTSGDKYTITPAMFQQIVDYLIQNQMTTVTTRAGVKKLFSS